MAAVEQIPRNKGSYVMTVSGQATVRKAAIMMNDHHVGTLVVTKGRAIEGIFTERDVLRRVVTADHNLRETCDRRIRHLPVEDDAGARAGLISISDLNAFESSDRERTLHHLQDYLYGLA